MNAHLESELRRLITEAGWACKMYFMPLSIGPVVSLTWPMPDNAPETLPGREMGTLHMGHLLTEVEDAAEVFANLKEETMRIGLDETADGWRTSFDPVIGKFYRNNVCGEVA